MATRGVKEFVDSYIAGLTQPAQPFSGGGQMARRQQPGIVQSPFDRQVTGAMEAAGAMGTGFAGAVPAGLEGLFTLARTGSPLEAGQRVEQVQEALTYRPRTQEGQEAFRAVGEVLSPLSAPSEYVGQTILDITGSPALATFGEVALDPLDKLVPGLKAVGAGALGAMAAVPPLVGKAAKRGSAVNLRRQDEMLEVTPPPELQEIMQQRVAMESEAAGKPVRPKIKIDDLTTYFEQDHVNRYGRKLDPYDEADFEEALEAAAQEVEYQLQQAVSGKGWYDSDVRKTFENASRIPGLESLANNETDRVIWSALAAPTSIGNDVDLNTKAATAAFLQYKRNGEVPTTPPKPGAVTEGIAGAGWGVKGKSVAAGMKVIDHLIKKYGEEGFADWWMSPHTLGELTQLRKEAGLSGAPSGLSGGKDSMHLGAKILGDKTGQYSLNINGYQGTTKDVWFSRTFGRLFGDLRDAKGAAIGGPRNAKERRRMEEFTRRLTDKIESGKLSEQDAQAVLWFFEQNLYSDLGVPSRPGSFSKGMEKVDEQLRRGVREGDEAQAGLEPPSPLEGFRGLGQTQRTVRAQRRLELPGRDNAAGDGGAPRAYARGAGQPDGGTGLLTLEPSPEVAARYNESGLNLPAIRQQDAAQNAAEYSATMRAAMAGNPMGAQVEIKSPEDLAQARLFRTDNGSGFAIKDDGDVVAVFASPDEPKGGAYAMLQAAVEAGGRKLDAFDTYLPKIYEAAGFRPVARLKWNDEYQPPGWDKETFKNYNNGEPDVVFFVYDPNYFGGTGKLDVPYVDEYDEGVALQSAKMKELAPGVERIYGK